MFTPWLSMVDVYRPPLSPWLIGAMVALALIAAAAAYARAAGDGGRVRAAALAGLRLLALAGVAWVLAGPSVMRGVEPGDRQPRISVLVDTSASMTERDVESSVDESDEPMTRFDAIAQHWLEPAFLGALGERARLELLGFDESIHRLEPGQAAAHDPDGEGTHLLAAIERIVRANDAPDVAVVLSDGRDTRDAMSDRLLGRLAEGTTRLFTVPLGAPHRGPHLALEAWPEADVLHAGESTTIHAAVSQHGYADREIGVGLYHDGERIDARRIAFDDDRAARRVRFDVTPPGPGPRSVALREYELRLGGAEGLEAADGSSQEHHRDRVFVQVSRERIRVALLEGEPHWDTRFLARVLRRDRRVALDAVHALGAERTLQLTDEQGERLALDALDAEALGRFDVVILGKGAERFFPGNRAALLKQYIREHGGALVLARGRPFDMETDRGREAMAHLEPVAPVTWGEGELSRLRVALTPEGAQSPLLALDEALAEPGDDGDDEQMLLTRWPQMIAATRIESTRAASEVLLRQAAKGQAPAMASLVHARAGRGRVLAVLSDGLWRWALLADDEQAERGVYELLWRRAMRWLAADGDFLPGQDVALTLDRTVAEPDEPVNVSVATRHAPEGFDPVLMRVDPAGARHRVRLERAPESATEWRGTLRAAEPGVHRLELHAPDQPELASAEAPIVSHLAVRRRSIETLDTAARPEVLETLAERSGGASLALDETDRLLEFVRDLGQARRVAREPAYAFARWPAFAMIALCLGLEWLLRRRSGWL